MYLLMSISRDIGYAQLDDLEGVDNGEPRNTFFVGICVAFDTKLLTL